MKILSLNRFIVACCLFMLPVAGGAASLAEKLTPGATYYFDSFNPGQQPWQPSQHLNIEEVFKNYQYYEIVLDQDGQGMTVSHYIQGVKKESGKFRILPDGSLQKK